MIYGASLYCLILGVIVVFNNCMTFYQVFV